MIPDLSSFGQPRLQQIQISPVAAGQTEETLVFRTILVDEFGYVVLSSVDVDRIAQRVVELMPRADD